MKRLILVVLYQLQIMILSKLSMCRGMNIHSQLESIGTYGMCVIQTIYIFYDFFYYVLLQASQGIESDTEPQHISPPCRCY